MANKRVSRQAQEVPINVVGSSKFAIYPKISAEVTYNMFISDEWLINYAGYERVLNLLPAGVGRGLFHSIRGNFILAVVNNTVFKINSSLIVFTIGTIATESGEVFIDENLNDQICIVDGLNAYIYNHGANSGIVVQTLSPTFTPNYVCYHNTYFLFGNADQSTNGSAWYAYSYSSATVIVESAQLALQTKPDYAIAVRRIPGQGNQVLVFGTSVCEIHTQVAGVQVYARVPTINVDYGCISISTIAASDTFVAWLGANESNSPVIMIFSGQGATPISTDGIDYVMGNIKNPAKSTAYFWRPSGHLFYVLTFYDPADNITLAYDFTTKSFINLSDENLNYHPATDIVAFNQQNYFLSLNNASLYRISQDLVTINENITTTPMSTWDAKLIYDIQRIRVCKNVLLEDNSRFRVNSFNFTLEQGLDPDYKVGSLDALIQSFLITEDIDGDQFIVSENGNYMIPESGALLEVTQADPLTYPPLLPAIYMPRIDLSFSKDGGITWSGYVARTMQPYTVRQNMLHWENMGMANDFTIKLRFWGHSRFVINNGVLQIF